MEVLSQARRQPASNFGLLLGNHHFMTTNDPQGLLTGEGRYPNVRYGSKADLPRHSHLCLLLGAKQTLNVRFLGPRKSPKPVSGPRPKGGCRALGNSYISRVTLLPGQAAERDPPSQMRSRRAIRTRRKIPASDLRGVPSKYSAACSRRRRVGGQPGLTAPHQSV